jgi:hypothetical protein
MTEADLTALVEMLFAGKSTNDQIHAHVEIEHEGLGALQPLLEGLINYLQLMRASGRSPHPQATTPFEQLTFGYIRPVQNILIGWEVAQLPVLEALINLLEDPNRDMRVLALMCLASPIAPWVENPERAAWIRATIEARQADPDRLVRTAASFAVDLLEQIRYAFAKRSGDLALRQRLERSAFQIIHGLGRSSAP